MRKSTMPWFLAGFLITLAAFFGSHAGDLSMVERIVSPQYVDAHRALRKLETRVDRVERTVGATVDLLHNLLHPDKARPGTSTER